MQHSQLIRAAAVSQMTGVPDSTLATWRSLGVGPEWIRLGPRLIAYPLAEGETWIDERTRLTAESRR